MYTLRHALLYSRTVERNEEGRRERDGREEERKSKSESVVSRFTSAHNDIRFKSFPNRVYSVSFRSAARIAAHASRKLPVLSRTSSSESNS